MGFLQKFVRFFSLSAQQVPGAPWGWVMPKYKGHYICDWKPIISTLKREDRLDEALVLAQGCMDAMITAAKKHPYSAMEHYVIEVVKIQHKMKDYAGEIFTIESWLALEIAPARQDFRIDLLKRLAKAKELNAKQTGQDPAPHKQQWQHWVEMAKTVTNDPKHPCVEISSGKSLVKSGSSTPYYYLNQNRRQKESTHHRKRAAHHKEHDSVFMPTPQQLAAPAFVAVDFETGNRNDLSACQVALVKVERGVIVDQFSTLMKPPSGVGRFQFSQLHGITAAHVRNAPTWEQLAGQIAAFTAGLPTYAHNAAFDAGVWRALDGHYGTRTFPREFFCTVQLAKQLVPGLPDYKLPTVTRALLPGFQLNHHEATSDAQACALTVAALQQRQTR